MRISDWSSDVCSSDLKQSAGAMPAQPPQIDPLPEHIKSPHEGRKEFAVSSISTRITQLERTIRKSARAEFEQSVSADFAAAINRAAGNDAICSQLIDARRAFVKSAGKAAEDAALEAFLAAKDPQPAASPLISLDALYSPEIGRAHV